MTANITIPVSNVVNLIGQGFTKIEIWRSNPGELVFAEITDSIARPAGLESNVAQSTFTMGGRALGVKVNSGPESMIDFSPIVTYWTPTQVANRINEVVASLATVSGNKVVLTSPTTGRASSLEITYSDSPDLGFVSGQKTLGKDARITLLPGTVIYPYSDLGGSVGDYYKWRYSNNGVNPISDYAGFVEGEPAPVGSVTLSIATATFIDINGKLKKTSVVVATDLTPMSISTYYVGNQHIRTYSSDDLGFLQIPMVAGSKVRVAIEGTHFIREIIVPDSPTFDLIQAMASADDPFTVQTIPPYLIRRNI